MQPTSSLPFHRLADAFPLIDGQLFDELVASIKANGLRHPIVMLDGAILDGRNRYRACEVAGVAPRFVDFSGSDPLAFVIDENLTRRHLNESQRAMVAARLATLRRGDVATQRAPASDGVEISTPHISAGDAARMMNVNRSTVQHAKIVIDKGTPEEIKAVQDGKVGASSIARQIRDGMPPADRAPDRQKRKATSHSARAETHRAKGAMWGELRDALTHMNNLPSPADAAAAFRKLPGDKAARAEFIARHMPVTINWMKEFLDEWERDPSADRAA